MTSVFCREIYNDFSLVNRFVDTYSNSDWQEMRLKQRSKICRLSSQTSSYNAALNQVNAALGIQKFLEGQQKAIDMFFEGNGAFVLFLYQLAMENYEITSDSSLEETVHSRFRRR